jgi:hypothetical protein
MKDDHLQCLNRPQLVLRLRQLGQQTAALLAEEVLGASAFQEGFRTI